MVEREIGVALIGKTVRRVMKRLMPRDIVLRAGSRKVKPQSNCAQRDLWQLALTGYHAVLVLVELVEMNASSADGVECESIWLPRTFSSYTQLATEAAI